MAVELGTMLHNAEWQEVLHGAVTQKQPHRRLNMPNVVQDCVVRQMDLVDLYLKVTLTVSHGVQCQEDQRRPIGQRNDGHPPGHNRAHRKKAE